jgi:signal transduction histidine kinase
MKRDDWGLLKINPYVNRTLWGALWLIGSIACLALFWMFIWAEPVRQSDKKLTSVERWVEPLSHIEFTQTNFSKLAQRPLDFSQAHWESVSLPDIRALPIASATGQDSQISQAWFRFTYVVPENVNPSSPLALYGTRIMGGGAYSVWVNRQLTYVNLENWRMQWNHPLFIPVPLQLSQPGQTIEIILAFPFREGQGYAVGSLYFDEAQDLNTSYKLRHFFQTTLPSATMIVGLLMGLLSLQFFIARRKEAIHGILFLSSVAWFICNLQYSTDFSKNEAASVWFGQIVDASISWMLLFTFMFAVRLNSQSYPKREAAFAAYVLINTVITLPFWQWEMSALLLQHWILVFVSILSILSIAREYLKTRSIEQLVLTVSLFFVICFGVHDLLYTSSQTHPDHIFMSPYGTIMIFVSFIFATQRKYLGALEVAENANTTLSSKLAAKETELREKHNQLIAIEQRQAILLERQRLAKDMHDGVGSSLMASLSMAENKHLDSTQVRQVLRECLDDLKLVIESLEPIEHDLSTLLGSLRYRIGDRLEGAGLKVLWQMDDLPALTWLDAPQALRILRIVQEIITNTLKHAKANSICIATSLKTTPNSDQYILVRIEDDGVGFDTANYVAGRGLQNIRDRADSLNAVLNINSTLGKGTVIELRLAINQN